MISMELTILVFDFNFECRFTFRCHDMLFKVLLLFSYVIGVVMFCPAILEILLKLSGSLMEKIVKN